MTLILATCAGSYPRGQLRTMERFDWMLAATPGTIEVIASVQEPGCSIHSANGDGASRCEAQCWFDSAYSRLFMPER
jgi:hypothetical protein